MTIFNPLIDRLPEPDVLAVSGVGVHLAELKRTVLEIVGRLRPDDVAAVAETLENDAELATIILQASAQILTVRERRLNDKIRSILMLWAKGSNLDARAAEFGVQRQVIKKGDPNAFPPVPDELESDDDVLIRTLLAPFGFGTTGSELAYQFHAMTLGERPHIGVSSPKDGQVVLTYTFPPGTRAAEVKDARARMAAPETGRMNVWILGRAGDGTPTPALVAASQAYLDRPDIRLGTDTLTALPAEIKPYQIHVRLHGGRWPGGEIDPKPVEQLLLKYAAGNHRLATYIDPSEISHLCRVPQTVTRVDVLHPATAHQYDVHQAPYCTGVTVEVVYG
ncbi:MAG: baseplate J/gp47 family protein [Candidatus Oceanisphaera merdipullorum]|nr:baseplate J/gp47 family protein [Candidatus Oceanisphaera merdipullorum]